MMVLPKTSKCKTQTSQMVTLKLINSLSNSNKEYHNRVTVFESLILISIYFYEFIAPFFSLF